MPKRLLLPLNIDRWDSNFFKRRIARLRISADRLDDKFKERLSDLLNRARAARINFMVIKLDNPSPIYEKALIGMGFRRYGENLDSAFEYRKKKQRCLLKRNKVRLLRPKDKKTVRAIAKDAFRLSYLYKCGFGKRAMVDRYHSVWAENLIKDKDTKVFVAEKKRSVVGFVTLTGDKRKKTARIILIAVDKRFRGLGIGTDLIKRCIDWGEGRLKAIFINTQAHNIRAFSLYKKMGFKIVGGEKIFSKRI